MTRYPNIKCLIAIAMFCVSTQLQSQSKVLINQGEKIRVTCNCYKELNQTTVSQTTAPLKITGLLQSYNTIDSLVIETPYSTKVISSPCIQKFQVYDGQKSNVLTGLCVGAALGGVIGILVYEEDDSGTFIGSINNSIGRPSSFAAGVMIGGLVGGLVGLAVETPKWKEIKDYKNRVVVGASLSFNGIGLRIQF